MSKLNHQIQLSSNDYTDTISFKGTDFNALVRIIKPMMAKTDMPVIISDSMISQPLWDSTFNVFIDMREFLKNNYNNDDLVNIGFLAGKQDVQNMEQMMHKEEILLWFDKSRSLYLVTDGNTLHELLPNTMLYRKAPTDLEKKIMGVQVSNLSLKGMKGYIGKASRVFFLVYKDQVEQICIQGKNPYTFFPENIRIHQEKKPDHILESEKFLRIAGKKDLSISIAKDASGAFWLITKSKLILGVEASTYEQLKIR